MDLVSGLCVTSGDNEVVHVGHYARFTGELDTVHAFESGDAVTYTQLVSVKQDRFNG